MIIDFHIHYTPEELVRDKLNTDGSPKTVFVNGQPAYTFHEKLFTIDKHLACMDKAGISIGVLSSGAGLTNDIEKCRLVNNKLREIEKTFPKRFLGLAHVPPLGGESSYNELKRSFYEFGFKGVAIPSVIGEIELDSEKLFPFYNKVQELGLFIFIHPALSSSGNYLDYDLGRSVGREFQLVISTIRLINGGVLDEFPELRFIISHLGGGISALIGRIEPYQDKEFWGTKDHPRHGKRPRKPFREYFDQLTFDTGGFFGNINAVKCALLEIKPQRIVFGTDYPQEIRDENQIERFINEIKNLSISQEDIENILSLNGKRILKID